MDKIVPISDFQSNTKDLVESVGKTHDPIIITQRGRPAALLVNYEDYEALLHTFDEMSYPDWQEKLTQAENDIRNKKGKSLKTFKTKLTKNRDHR